MKKIIVFATACMLAVTVGNAQVIENDFGSTAYSSSGTYIKSDQKKKNESRNSASLDIRFPKEGWGIGTTIVWFDYFVLTYFTDNYKNKDYDGYEICDRKDSGVAVGGNYRFWPTEKLFVEGQAGIGWMYGSSSAKIQGTNTAYHSSDDDYFVYITPRAGYKVHAADFADFYITLGYRWDAPKFKFSKDDGCVNGLTIGVTAAF